MDRIRIHSLALLMLILAMGPETESLRHRPLPIPLVPPLAPRPLCASQFSLVNYACARLPYSPAPPLPSPFPPTPPTPTPTPPSPPDDGEESHHRHRVAKHGHRHRHRHGDHHDVTSKEENCCRWLKEVDSECVCDLLVRLPTFLARPVHEYTVIVDDTCNVTFSCAGRLIS